MLLTKARSLLTRYQAAQLSQKHNNYDNNVAESAEGDCPCAPVTQLSMVISAFDEAIAKLLKLGKSEAAAQAMSELGDVMWHSGQSKAASRWWKGVLSTLAGIQAPPIGWRNVLQSSGSVLTELGMWGCLLAALNAVKLARYVSTYSALAYIMKTLGLWMKKIRGHIQLYSIVHYKRKKSSLVDY